MSDQPEVIFHLGLHKTATGTLQRQFFPACEKLNLLTTSNASTRSFVAYVKCTDPLYFDGAHARSLLSGSLDSATPNLLSNESLSGPPYAGVIEGGLDHRSPILTNIRSTFSNARAIIVLRRQDGLAKSMYRQYLKSGGTRTVRRFYGLSDAPHPPLFSLDRFRFSRYVDAVHEYFPEGVLVLLFENFVTDQENFLGQLTDFVGIPLPTLSLQPENATSLGATGLEMTRIFNHLFRSLLNPAGFIPGVKVTKGGQTRRVTPLQFVHDKWPGRGGSKGGEIARVAAEILEIARADNMELDSRYDLGLKQHGYY